MPLERTVRRYTAYFRGWCQAFGEHDLVAPPDEDISWLFGENQIGFILSSELTRSLSGSPVFPAMPIDSPASAERQETIALRAPAPYALTGNGVPFTTTQYE